MVSHAAAMAGLIVEVDEVRMPVVMRGAHPYVGLTGVAHSRSLEVEYSVVGDVYEIRNPHPETGTAVLRLRPGRPEVEADGRVVTLKAPPIETTEGLQVPLHDFLAFFLTPEELAGVRLELERGEVARLIAVRPFVRTGVTKLLFEWEGAPSYTVRADLASRTVLLVFEGARLQIGQGRVPLDTPEATALDLSERPELLQVQVVVQTPAPVKAEGFFLQSRGEFVLTLQPDAGAEAVAERLPEEVSEDERAWLAERVVGIDAGHGGGDRGAALTEAHDEKSLALAAAQDLAELLGDTGVRTELVRQDDRVLPMKHRIHQLNRARVDLVVSLHARSGQPTEATTAPLLLTLPVPPLPPPPADLEGEAPALLPDPGPGPLGGPTAGLSAEGTSPSTAPAARSGPTLSERIQQGLRPSRSERLRAQALAGRLAARAQQLLGAEAPQVEDDALLPLRGVLAPGVVVDLGPLEIFAAPDAPDFETDPARSQVVYAVYLGVLDHLRALQREWRAQQASLEAARATAPDPLAPPPGATLDGEVDVEGYRRDVLGSPEDTWPPRPRGGP